MAEETTFDPNAVEGLEDIKDVWEGGKSHQRDDQPVGIFAATISSATFSHSQASGRPQIVYELVINGGDHKGKVIRKYDGLDTPQQASIAQNSLRTLGVDVKAIKSEQLPAVLVSLKGRTITIRTKQNDEFYNIYFQKQMKQHAPGAKATVGKAPKKF